MPPEIRLDTLMDAYRHLMAVYWLKPGEAPTFVLQNACMETAVTIKATIGSDKLPVLEPPPKLNVLYENLAASWSAQPCQTSPADQQTCNKGVTQ